MPARRQPYFAYGSNLCVTQMALWCPDAVNPRPAVLADHHWLINQRGVATVEPFAGNQVHGVLWHISDDDLATLDTAEGVPLRYRRDRLTVHTGDGPSPAWVYIDHRVNPGPPRPGYLRRIIDGAVHHGLPQRWIDFLRRWDPARWPRPVAATSPAPQSLSALLNEPGVIEEGRLRSRFGFLAIHGGGLEEMTDVIAERAAEAADASVYLLRHPDRYPHHLPSALYDPDESPRLAEFLDHVDVAVSVHGYGRIGRGTQLLAGGRNRALAAHLARHIQLTGYQVVTDIDDIPPELRGLHPNNPVNRVRDGGTQLELSVRVRGLSPRSPLPSEDGLSPVTTALVQLLGGCGPFLVIVLSVERRLLVDKDFRFGLSMRFFKSRAALVDKVKRAEDLGYDIFCVPDHLGAAAPSPTLTAVAMVTSRIRLSMYVLNAGFYKPALLSRDLQALNMLSDGRLEIGLGTGYVREEFEAAELPYPSAGARVDYLEHMTTYLKEHHPTTPILIAGNGDRVLTLAACHADIIGLTGARVRGRRRPAGRTYRVRPQRRG